MKKFLKIGAGVMLFFLAVIIVVPLVVDVDKYRPQIIKAANEKLNGTLELGKLKLSLWGKVYIGADGFSLKDKQGRTVVAVKDASFVLPFTSILSGSPLITISMKQPDIRVIKNKEGKLNVMSLMKVSAADAAGSTASSTTSSTPTSTASAPAASSGKVELPAMVMNAHIGLFIENAKLVYQDELMALSNTVDNFNFRVKDFSLTRATELEIWADLKTTMGSDLKVQGPLKLIAELKPEISLGEFKSASLIANFTADDLDIEKGTLFHKTKGVAAHFKFNGKLSQESLTLTEATARFHNAEVTVSGVYHKESGANLDFKAKPIELKSWSDLIPMLKEYDLDGQLNLVGFVKGKPEALTYQATLGVKSFSAKGPNLKAKPVLNGEIVITPDRIEKMVFDLKAPGNEIKLNAKLFSFSKPQIQFSLKSDSGMDLDQLIEFPATQPTHSSVGPSLGVVTAAFAADKTAEAEDYDLMLDALRKNEIAKAMSVDGDVAISFIKAKNIRTEAIAAKVQFKNMIAALTGISLKMFDGVMKGSFSTDLKPAHPDYNMKLTVTGFDMTKAVESQFQSFKNTMSGKLSTSVEGGGTSFNPDMAKKKLKMKGSFQLANAQFKTIDIAKTVNEALNSSVAKIGDKVPVLKGKKLSVSNNGDTRYEMVSSSFTIQDGFLTAPDFVAKAAVKRGVDLKGSTKMGLVDESLDAKWEVIDTQRVTGADQLNVDIGGKMVKNILAKGENDPVILPIKVGCKWSAPCANYSEVPEYLAGIALGRVTKGAGEAAKQKATNAIQDAIKKNLGGGGGNNPLGNGLKKLFGN